MLTVKTTRRTRLIVLAVCAGLLVGLACVDLLTGPRWVDAAVKLALAGFAVYGYTRTMTERPQQRSS